MVTLEGMRKTHVQDKDGQETIMCDVLYDPYMARNLIILVKLLEKDYTMRLEDKDLKVLYGSSMLILKTTLLIRKTF